VSFAWRPDWSCRNTCRQAVAHRNPKFAGNGRKRSATTSAAADHARLRSLTGHGAGQAGALVGNLKLGTAALASSSVSLTSRGGRRRVALVSSAYTALCHSRSDRGLFRRHKVGCSGIPAPAACNPLSGSPEVSLAPSPRCERIWRCLQPIRRRARFADPTLVAESAAL